MGANPTFFGLNRGASGGATPALIAHGSAANLSAATTAPLNTAGANLIVIVVGWFSGASPSTVTISDSLLNIWTPLTTWGHAGSEGLQTFYCYAPTVGASQTFTATGVALSICVAAFSNVASSPFDQQNGTDAISDTMIQTGPITPSQAHSVAVAAVGLYNDSTTVTVDSGFTITDQVAWLNNNNEGCGLAYKVLSSAAPVNVTFTSPVVGQLAASISNFKY